MMTYSLFVLCSDTVWNRKLRRNADWTRADGNQHCSNPKTCHGWTATILQPVLLSEWVSMCDGLKKYDLIKIWAIISILFLQKASQSSAFWESISGKMRQVVLLWYGLNLFCSVKLSWNAIEGLKLKVFIGILSVPIHFAMTLFLTGT